MDGFNLVSILGTAFGITKFKLWNRSAPFKFIVKQHGKVISYSVADPLLFYPLDRGSGSGMDEFFSSVNLGSRIRPFFW
jgi:hypothetical protein